MESSAPQSKQSTAESARDAAPVCIDCNQPATACLCGEPDPFDEAFEGSRPAESERRFIAAGSARDPAIHRTPADMLPSLRYFASVPGCPGNRTLVRGIDALRIHVTAALASRLPLPERIDQRSIDNTAILVAATADAIVRATVRLVEGGQHG